MEGQEIKVSEEIKSLPTEALKVRIEEKLSESDWNKVKVFVRELEARAFREPIQKALERKWKS